MLKYYQIKVEKLHISTLIKKKHNFFGHIILYELCADERMKSHGLCCLVLDSRVHGTMQLQSVIACLYILDLLSFCYCYC